MQLSALRCGVVKPIPHRRTRNESSNFKSLKPRIQVRLPNRQPRLRSMGLDSRVTTSNRVTNKYLPPPPSTNLPRPLPPTCRPTGGVPVRAGDCKSSYALAFSDERCVREGDGAAYDVVDCDIGPDGEVPRAERDTYEVSDGDSR